MIQLHDYHITVCQEKNACDKTQAFSICKYKLLVSLLPLLDLGLSQAQDVLGGVDGSLAAADMQEVQALGSLVQVLLVTSGIAQLTERISLDQSSGLGIVLLLANDLLHG